MSKVPKDTIEIGLRELATWDGWVKDSENSDVVLYEKKVFSDKSSPSIKVSVPIMLMIIIPNQLQHSLPVWPKPLWKKFLKFAEMSSTEST